MTHLDPSSMSSHHYIEEIQIYILPIDFRRFLEESPEIKRNVRI